MAVLYRKYRPQSFGEVVNQTHVVATLKHQVATGSPAHAYLFTGSRGVGKTSVARIFAKALNCPKRKGGEPCLGCDVCAQVAAGSFLDLIEIDAASHTGVDNVRELIEHVKFSPSAGRYKVFIIDEVHMLSKGAFNALLKTLEEPPQHAVFVLATTEVGKVPATIVSRTQRFDFKSLSREDLRRHLAQVAQAENLKLPPAVLDLVAVQAQGSVRDALSLLGKVASLGPQPTLEACQQLLGVTDLSLSLDLVALVAERRPSDVPAFVDRLLEHGVDIHIFNRDLLEVLRSVLVYRVTAGALPSDLAPEIAEIADRWADRLTAPEVMFVTRLFLRSYKELSASPSPEIPLLLAALEAAAPRASAPPSSGTPSPQKPVAAPRAAEPSKAPKPPSAPARDAATEEAVEPLSEVTLPEVQGVWDRVIEAVKAVNAPLGNLLKGCPLKDVAAGRAVVSVRYQFHKQNLENSKNQSVISLVLKDMLGKNVGLKAEVAPKEVQAQEPQAGSLAGALQIFGGELVD